MKELKKGSPEFILLQTLTKRYNCTDLSNIYSIEEQSSPLISKKTTIDNLVEETGFHENRVKRIIKNIEKHWELPHNIPIGIFSEDEARIRRLARQERLRRDEKNDCYKEDQIYLFMSELGLCSTYTDPDTYKGLPIFMESMGFDKKLKGVMMQGGLIPENPFLWSKTNQERAKQISKSIIAEEKGIEINEVKDKDAEKKAKEILVDVFGSKELSKKDKEYYMKFAYKTPNTYEKISEESAYWLAPFFGVIPSKVPIFYQWSMADYFNTNQLLESVIFDERLIAAQKAQVNELPQKRKDHIHMIKQKAIHEMTAEFGNYVFLRLKRVKEKKAKELTDYINNKIYKGTVFEKKKKQFKRNLLKEFGLKRFTGFDMNKTGKIERFDDFIDKAMLRYTVGLNTLEQIKTIQEKKGQDVKNLEEKISELEDDITELDVLNKKLKEETRARMAWLTKKRTITNEQAKVTHYVVKERYKDFQWQTFKTISKILNKKHDVRILSSLMITLSSQIRPSDYRKGKLFASSVTPEDISHYVDIGDLKISLIPNPDFQQSNVPKIDDIFRTKKMFEGSLSKAVAINIVTKNGEIPSGKTKYHSLASSDIIFTGYGARGPSVLPQQAIGETWVKGEYRPTSRRVLFVKGGPMHSGDLLEDVGSRWKSGTWPIKRKQKGGFQAGPLLYINKANKKPIFLFPETYELAKIGKKYWKDYQSIKEQLKNKKLSKQKKKDLEENLENIFKKVKFNFKKILLSKDQHAGVYDMAGRPISTDTVRTTLTNVLDEGYPDMAILSEMVNGSIRIGEFNIKEQGKGLVWPEKQSDLYYIQKAYEKEEITKDEKDKILYLHKKEQEAVESRWKIEDQLDIHELVAKPALEDMLLNGTKIVFIDGNHYLGEARLVAGRYLKQYQRAGRMEVYDSKGDGARASTQIYLDEKTNLKADIYHKAWGGKTPTSNIYKQLHGTRTQASVCFAGHRHHGQWEVSGWKMIYLDHGHQTDNLYVRSAGKTGSLRGSLIAYIPTDGRFISGVEFVDDVSNDVIMAWPEEAGLLTKMHQVIKKYREADAEKQIAIYKKTKEKMDKLFQE